MNKSLDEDLPGTTRPPLSETEQQPDSTLFHHDKYEFQALSSMVEGATSSAPSVAHEAKIVVAGDAVKDASEGIAIHPLKPDEHSSPGNSFFDDAFFVTDEHKEDEDNEMQSMASILDRIDNLLVPLPAIPTSNPNRVSSDELSMLSTLNWEYHKQLPPLNIDATLETALPWAPLPPRQGDRFSEESLEEPETHTAAEATEPIQKLIGVIDNIKDEEVQELSERQDITKPQSLTKNSLDTLIRLRLQRSTSERAPPSSSHILPPQSKIPTPILPSADDPGATSKLVSAFMTLRGVKKPRAHRK